MKIFQKLQTLNVPLGVAGAVVMSLIASSLFAITASATSLGTNVTVTGLTVTNTLGVASSTPSLALGVQGSALFSGDLGLANLVATGTVTTLGLTTTYATTTYATTTNDVVVNSVVTNFSDTYGTTTNATSTNSFATTASSTNLYSKTLYISSNASLAATNGSVSISTTTTSGVLNIGTDSSSASTTIMMGKLQFDGYSNTGVRTCVELVGTAFVAVAGACNP